jgi:hypothetical protein
MMAVDVPTVEEILQRFPALTDQSVLVSALLEEASKQVDERWRTEDQKIAIMYLTAHLVTVEVESGGGTGGSGVSMDTIASESIGSFSISYANKSSQGTKSSADDLMSTIYGRRYAAYRRANFGGVIVAGGDDV